MYNDALSDCLLFYCEWNKKENVCIDKTGQNKNSL